MPERTKVMTTFQPTCGTDIRDACDKAVAMADKSGFPVTFKFNGVTVVVQTGETPEDALSRWEAGMNRNAEAYRDSPEGKAMAEWQEAREKQCQRDTDALLARLPNVVHDLTALVRWCVSLSESADHVGVSWNPSAVADAIEAAGWKIRAHVGRPEKDFDDKTVLGEYLIGQSLDCLRIGMPPHRIVEKFAKDGGFLQ